MKRITLVFFLFAGCTWHPFTPKAPPPANVASAPALKSSDDEQKSKAAASVKAAATANASNLDSPAKLATAGELSVAAANLPTPSAKDDAEAQARVNAALTGKLADAEQGWANARTAAGALAEKVKSLETQVAAEREAAAKELQCQLQAARDEARKKAEAEQRRLIGWIFYGGAFLLTVAAAIVLGTAQYVPFFGPKLAIALGIAGAASACGGVALNEILANPWIVRVMLGVVVAAIAAGAGLAWSNHQHHVESMKGATPA